MACGGPKYTASFIEGILECCVCLGTVKDPYALQECLHSVCKACMDSLLQKQNNDPPGVVCPICRKFSSKDKIMSNFFAKELAEMHSNLKRKEEEKERVVCEQCYDNGETVDACCRCVDCRALLCQACKTAHQKIKMLRGHKIVGLDEAQDQSTAAVVFCSKHQDKLIELYCHPCKLPICITCKATKHEGHQSDTLEGALEQIIPGMLEKIKVLDDRINQITESVDIICLKIDDTKQKFAECYQQINEIAEAKKKHIESTRRNLLQSMNKKEEEEIIKLTEIKDNFQLKKLEKENVMSELGNIMEKAQNTKWLNDLTSDALEKKINEVLENKEPAVKLSLSQPRFYTDDTKWNALRNEDFLGAEVYNSTCLLITSDAALSIDLQAWPVDFNDFFSKGFRKCLEIKPAGNSFKMKVVKDEIWVPLYKENIKIFSSVGELRGTIQVDHPMAVEKAHNGDVFIACHSKAGLYVLLEGDSKLVKLSEGSYADVYAYEGIMYAVKYDVNIIEEYLLNSCSREVIQRWKCGKKLAIAQISGAYDKLIVTGGKQIQFIVSHCDKQTICLYDITGHCIKQFDNLYQPWVCGLDQSCNVLVVDQQDYTLKFLNLTTGSLVSTQIKSDNRMRDCKLDDDGNLYVCERFDDNGCAITKYVCLPKL